MRSCWLVVALAGCDKLFSLVEVPDASLVDAAVDASADTSQDAFDDPGCADGTREGFGDRMAFPSIAACGGAWSLPGLRGVTPMCAHASGNDGARPGGAGCSAADLCRAGWHVCQDQLDVMLSLPGPAASCATLGAEPNTFFATAASGPSGNCAPAATDDFSGCGTYGPAAVNCPPLDRTSDNMCFALGQANWSCPDSVSEVTTVTKVDPFHGGGVLCCRDR